MGWRSTIIAAAFLADRAYASDSGIPYRPEPSGFGMQAGLAYGAVVLLLALAVGGMFLLRKRLGAPLSGPFATADGLRSVASLRLPQQTLVHVVAYRDREILFAQCGGELLQLAHFRHNAKPVEPSA